MFWRFFRHGERYVNVKGDGTVVEKKNRWIIFLIIGAICFLAFGNFGGQGKEREDRNEKDKKSEIDVTEYSAQTEERLCDIISDIKGVGTVRVMVSFESLGEKILAKDSKNELSSDEEGEKSSSSSGNEENIFLYGSGAEEKPFVVKECLPVPSGVLVVATGADDEGVRLEVYEAVKALFGISGHRIKVTTAAKGD